MGAIFENFDRFVNENQSEIGSPNGILRMLHDSSAFAGFKDQLTDGYDADVRSVLKSVLDRKRESILEANVPASSLVTGWAVQSFPILVDIYAEPILSQLCNIHVSPKPIISIPKMWINARTRSFDGKSTFETTIPTATKHVYPDFMKVSVVPDTINNIYTLTNLDHVTMKMNKRFTMLTQINIVELDAATDAVRSNHMVVVNYRPDARNQINQEFNFVDAAKENVIGHISGNINYDDGIIQLHVNFMKGTSDSKYKCQSADFSLKFMPEETMNGRTEVNIKHEMTDLEIGINNDFIISLTEEEMQD